MTDQFTVSTKDRAVLQKFYKTSPAAMTRISAGVLTSMARADREQIPKTMDNLLTVRTPSIIKKATRFVPANKSQPINQQQSISGSIEIPQHDAWAHIQEGKATRITQFTDEGRGGSSKGVALKPAKAGKNKHQRPSSYNLRANQGTKFLQAVARQKTEGKHGRRKPFFLPDGHKSMGRGIYRFVGGSVGTYISKKRSYKRTLIGAKIKRLSTPKARVQPDRIDWKNKATITAVTERFVTKSWIDNAGREYRKIIPRS